MSRKERIRDEAGPAKYHRVTVIFSDRDSDLKLWCWQNPSDVGQILREGLRAELQRRGQLPAEGMGSTGHPARAAATADSAPAPVAPRPNSAPETKAAAHAPPHPTPSTAGEADRKDRLRAILQANGTVA